MKSVFFYGLFMDENLLKEKGLNPLGTKLAHVDGYGLRIGERATLTKSALERSYGTVIQVSEVELGKLYGDESVVDYFPEKVTAIDTEGSTLKAVSYILPMEKLSGKNSEYAKALSIVARKIGLPEEYVREVETWIK
jgi:hypothetical protein